MSDKSLPSVLTGRLAAMAERSKKTSESDKKLAKALKKELPKEPEQLTFQMPLIPNETSAGMPRGWTTTGIFSNVQPGKRRHYVSEILPSRKGSEILYTGPQLDMADNDVFLYAVILASGRTSNEKITFVRSRFLEGIGRPVGTSGYKWLHEALKRLRAATLFLENSHGDGRAYNLIKDLAWSTKRDQFWIELDPEVVRFYAEDKIFYIDFEKRLKLKAPLAKWLQNYVCGHTLGDWHYISVENLRVWSDSGSMKNFIASGRGLSKALEELVEQEIIDRFEFYERRNPGRAKERMVKWWRASPFALWLRDYALQQQAGWHVVDVERLRAHSKYKTTKSFLEPNKGLSGALQELEKDKVFEKTEIFTECGKDGKKITYVRWWMAEKNLSTTVGIAEQVGQRELA